MQKFRYTYTLTHIYSHTCTFNGCTLVCKFLVQAVTFLFVIFFIQIYLCTCVYAYIYSYHIYMYVYVSLYAHIHMYVHTCVIFGNLWQFFVHNISKQMCLSSQSINFNGHKLYNLNRGALLLGATFNT